MFKNTILEFMPECYSPNIVNINSMSISKNYIVNGITDNFFTIFFTIKVVRKTPFVIIENWMPRS